jgi:hypothetical protein
VLPIFGHCIDPSFVAERSRQVLHTRPLERFSDRGGTPANELGGG